VSVHQGITAPLRRFTRAYKNAGVSIHEGERQRERLRLRSSRGIFLIYCRCSYQRGRSYRDNKQSDARACLARAPIGILIGYPSRVGETKLRGWRVRESSPKVGRCPESSPEGGPRDAVPAFCARNRINSPTAGPERSMSRTRSVFSRMAIPASSSRKFGAASVRASASAKRDYEESSMPALNRRPRPRNLPRDECARVRPSSSRRGFIDEFAGSCKSEQGERSPIGDASCVTGDKVRRGISACDFTLDFPVEF